MKKSRFITLAIVVGLACIVSTPLVVSAAAPTVCQRLGDTILGRFITGQIGRRLVLRSELGITPEQRAEISSTLKTYRPQIVQVAKPVIEKHRLLQMAVLNDTPDEQAIRAAADQLGKAIGNSAVLASQICGEIRGNLTDEQIQKIIAFKLETAEAVDSLLQLMGQNQ